MRNGSNYGNRSYFPRHTSEDTNEEVMAAFIGQFYDNKPCPPEILVSVLPKQSELIAEALSSKAERKVAISKPSRGHRKQSLTDGRAQR